MKTKIKTIDIDALEWFDKVNGNSYFAGMVTVNYGMKTETRYKMPFQYGYGDQYRWEAFSELKKAGIIPDKYNSLWQYCDENKVILRANIQKNCKQRELKNI
jgi:hypothetical protein